MLAAARLFVQVGYAGTTISSIADEAGVAVQTVYAVFGNKQAIMAAVVDRAIAGDDAPVAINDRDWMQLVWTAPRAEERLDAYAKAVRRIMDGAGDALMALHHAGAVDPELEDLARTAEDRRRAGATNVIDSIREVSALRSGLSRAHAIDVLWTLNSPSVHWQLVRCSGWTGRRYEKWLAQTMRDQLLPAP